VAVLIAAWRQHERKRENTLRTIVIHEEHVSRILAGDKPIVAVGRNELEAYCAMRGAEPGKTGTVRPYATTKGLRVPQAVGKSNLVALLNPR
jgi:hypothetical protein